MTAGCPDRSWYRTHTHPEEFVVDWRAHYARFEQATHDLQAQVRWESISFGDSDSEVMDVYYPPRLDEPAPIVPELRPKAEVAAASRPPAEN